MYCRPLIFTLPSVCVTAVLCQQLSAAQLSGTINLADVGSSVGGAIFHGIEERDYSGFSVSSAGDINGDGQADVLIGSLRGEASYLFYGVSGTKRLSGNFNLANADVTFKSIETRYTDTRNDDLGYSVSSAGDVNGDGLDDLLIGAPNASIGSGKTFLVYGNSNESELSGIFDVTNADVTFHGIAQNDSSGSTVSSAGDVNGDGLADLLIGAPSAEPGGESYLIYGGSGTNTLSGSFDLTNADVKFQGGSHPRSVSGASLSSAGDVNGDGLDDVLIVDSIANESYLIYGASGTNVLSGSIDLADADVIFHGIDEGHQTGRAVSTAGDVNGDGLDDLIIGAPFYSRNSSDFDWWSGESYLIYGANGSGALSGSFDLAQADVTFQGVNAFDVSGSSVTSAGDVNGDGLDDLLIGAPRSSQVMENHPEETYLVYGGSGQHTLLGSFSLDNADVTFQGIHDHDEAGYPVSSAGDVNGDGLDDILIGASGADPGGKSSAGETYLIYGQAIPEPNTLALLNLCSALLLLGRWNCR